MKAIVIGGAGFIGSHLCEALLRDKNKVICVDNVLLGTRENVAQLLEDPNFVLYEADASVYEELSGIFEKEQPDYVFHLAANSDIQASAKDPDIDYDNTYTTTYTVLKCMRSFGVKNMFFASTSAVYGDKRDVLLDENTPNLAPISYYGAAKLGSEALISAFSYMNELNVLVFRFPNVIGPRLTHGVVCDFIKKLRRNPRELEILGDGRQSKPYIYVLDLVDAIMALREPKQPGIRLYNVGVEGETTVKKIADIMCEEMGLKDVEYHFTGGEGGWKGDVPRFAYSIDKIHAEGWRAKYNSDEAIRKAVRKNIQGAR